MALDTAAVQQPGFNIDFNPSAQQNREILDSQPLVGAAQSIADVLQSRQNEVKDSYNKMTDTLAEVDARDQTEFLSIIEDNRNQLKELARKGVNNKDYIAAKARIFSDLASKKKQSESFSAQLAEAYKYSTNPTSYATAEFNRKLQELQNTPLSKRRGNEIQQLMTDPTIHNVDKMIADAVIKTYGKEVEESYAVKKGNDVYKGTYVYNPLYSLNKSPNGEIDINNPKLNLTPDVINRIIANTARPDLVKQKLDLVLPDKLSEAGAGPISEADAFTSKLSSIIAQVIPQPRLKEQDIKLGSISGVTASKKEANREAAISTITDAIKNKNTSKLASMIGASSIEFVSSNQNKYLVPDYLNRGNFKLANTGKPDQKFSGIFIVGKDGKTYTRDYDQASPGTLAAKLYDENEADFQAGEKQNEGTVAKKKKPY